MSFIATLDCLFDEKNLIDLLYGYYLSYIKRGKRYWNTETLESVDTIPVEQSRQEGIRRSCGGGSIIGNTFTVVDIRTKETLFEIELENPKNVYYYESSHTWPLLCVQMLLKSILKMILVALQSTANYGL